MQDNFVILSQVSSRDLVMKLVKNGHNWLLSTLKSYAEILYVRYIYIGPITKKPTILIYTSL